MGPDGLVPQFAKGGKGKPDGGKVPVPLVNVTVTGGMVSVDDAVIPNPNTQQMELVRKGDIVKLRAYAHRKSPTGDLYLQISMTKPTPPAA